MTKKPADAAAEQAAAEAAAAEAAAAAAEQAAAEAAAAEQAAAEAADVEALRVRADVGPGQRAMRFVETHEVQDEHRGTPRATVYLAGQVYVLSEGSAQHFEGRGKAESV